MEKKTGRRFGVETTMYLFWDGYAKPSAAALSADIQRWETAAERYRSAGGLRELALIVAESGWPIRTPKKCSASPYAGRVNANAFWEMLLAYKPPSSSFRLFYWQFQDAEVDPCGSTWGLYDGDCKLAARKG